MRSVAVVLNEAQWSEVCTVLRGVRAERLEGDPKDKAYGAQRMTVIIESIKEQTATPRR